MLNKKIMILAIFLVSLLAVSAVSAADNATEDIAGVEKTANEVVSVNENQTISEDDVLRDSPGTFTDLAREIANAKNTLNLNRNYSYDFDYDYKDGIIIDKSIVINGNGYTINGNNQARAFYITASDVVLNNINFANLRCHSGQSSYYDMYDGGAILWEGEGTISNCNFVNCISERRGGAISWDSENGTLYGCSFVNCFADDMGGAIDAYGTVYDCSFVDCSSTEGGAVTGLGPNGVLRDCSFVNCSADSDGGAVWWFGDNGIISNCSFTDCSATDGGAIRWSGEKSSISDCYFMNCYSSGTGGAIYSWKIDNAVLSGCIFTDCHADGGSGAVYWEGSDGVLSDCSFIDCSADGSAGAVRWSASFKYRMWDSRYGVLRDCSFIDCSAGGNAGAVLWQGSYGSLSNCSFIDCSAGENGGAVYWEGHDGSVDSIFKKCQATHSGGGIYFAASYCSLINSTFKGNDAQNGPNWYSTETLNVINVTTSKISTVLNAPDVSIAYGDSKKLIVTLTDEDNDLIAGEKISIVLNNKEQILTTKSKGQVSLAIPTNLAPKTYVATIKYAGNDKYASSTVTANVIVNKASSTLTAPNVVTNYNSGKNLVATLKDASGKVISSAKVTIKLGKTTKTLTTNSNGQVSLTTDGLIPDTYVATISFEGNDVYDKSSTTAKVTINKLDTKLTARYDANSKNIVATVKDSNGNPIKGLKVGFALNGVKYVTTDVNGQAKYSTAGLADGTYKVTVQASGNEIYKDSNKETVTFTIGSKEMSKIFLRNALYFVTQTKMVQVTLWDENNQPLANKTVCIKAYDSIWKGITDENGNAYIRVGIGFGVHNATVSFDGDDQYFGSEKAGYIRVIKQTPSVMVRGADTMFKATNPVKIVKVHLRDRYDQPLPEGSKIVLKLNGKTYIGFTDAEGVARIAISINTVGTFTAQAMYGGNSAYNPVTRDVKIRIV